MPAEKLLLLDFDGTLCLGDDPVLAYAGCIDAALAERQMSRRLPRPVREILAGAFEQDRLLVEEIGYNDDGLPVAVAAEAAGTSTAKAHPVSWPLQDGYQLVQLLGQQAGLSAEETGACFRRARRELLAAGLEHTDVHAPPQARGLLRELRGLASLAAPGHRGRPEAHSGPRSAPSGVVIALITNSPPDAFAPWLAATGLEGFFDVVINSAQKPFGMPEALRRAKEAARGPVVDQGVLSVGDIWRNDLAHVADLGGETILIDRFGTGLGDPDHRVLRFAETVPLISGWTEGQITGKKMPR